MTRHQQCSGWRWGITRALQRYHRSTDHPQARLHRIRALGLIGALGMPLYFVLWNYCFPQMYESVALRLLGALLFLPALCVQYFNRKWFGIYLMVGLSYELPFFFTFMFLMNHASVIWSHSLLVALIVLFHFDTTLAARAYAIGTALACAAFALCGDAAFLLDEQVLQELPVHWFTIAVLSAVKVGRSVLEREKLAGLGAGLGSVAHELRTPLTSVDANVRGLNRMLQQSSSANAADQARARDALTRIQFEVRHMNHMIDLFLLSASAVSRNLRPNETVSMACVVDAVMKRYPFVGQMQQQAVAVEVRSNFSFAGQSELCVVILLNLLRNALKAIQRAGKGRIRIVVDGARQTPRLLFIDTGCGISPRHIPLIFQRFYSYPAHNGSGIGLALCKQIMEAWDARIRCISRESAYAIFVLEFPRPAPPPHH
ncbi:sensor histidine kinase [Janthinobacterium fluminis]|uniref:histidine kinase n=1 Tax=Janthinobacterium fluminis TaxID=2987524 RepID=A0ABT5K6G7_9BURK|nr:HAMP domain-containing sensor histidine kinase [Janthinobacterium fluminis]MDC8759357.1 HAMP domain-containing sensor histidine kinase [Janthinobacterium fluminis]